MRRNRQLHSELAASDIGTALNIRGDREGGCSGKVFPSNPNESSTRDKLSFPS